MTTLDPETHLFTSDGGITRLVQDMEKLFDEGKSGDLTFLVGPKEETIRSHSFLVRHRCKGFRGETRFPHASLEMFRAFLLYVYTGKLKLEEKNLFQMLCLAGDFGMEDLQSICEEMICVNLEPNIAFDVLTSALAAKQKGHKGLQAIIDKCIEYVGDNPGACLKAKEFLSIHVDTLVAIISSDQLCLEEDEVWRCVLRWAQHKAGVDTKVGFWSEDERIKVSKYLSPVMSHVRLLLIDSQVFAEEVEPTGCVPMALSLERYRFAALPSKVKEADPRLTPRNTPRLFQSSVIINNERVLLGRKLNEWYGSPKQSWRCVYRGSLHGFSADAFHNCVDGLCPTYVVVRLREPDNKWICGGFSDIPWVRSKSPKFVTSSNAFLFSYDSSSNTKKSQPVRYSVTKKHFAICYDGTSGPIWGAGADLFIADGCNANYQSYSNVPHSYESDEDKDLSASDMGSFLTPTYYFQVAEYEVFVPVESTS